MSFKATKRVPKKVNISFAFEKGKKVSFIATKRVPKKVPINFSKKEKRKS